MRTIFNQPRGLATLFFTEMWERMSYYGMRALLVLFMVDQVQRGGMDLTDEIATAIYGVYTAAVYLVALPGGWLADRLLGGQRAVWIGGIIIMFGHFVLAIPSVSAFYLDLILVVLGTGLLKPNISAMVGWSSSTTPEITWATRERVLRMPHRQRTASGYGWAWLPYWSLWPRFMSAP